MAAGIIAIVTGKYRVYFFLYREIKLRTRGSFNQTHVAWLRLSNGIISLFPWCRIIILYIDETS
jgi:hypothetical protein